MRILSIGNFGHGWDGSICDEEHIAKALEDMGHIVTRVQREDPDVPVTDYDIDFILIAQWDGYHASMIERLQGNYDCPIVYWSFDYQADGQEWHERLIKQSDLYLSKRIADSKYPNWQWLSQDFAPEFLKAIDHGGSTAPEIPKDIDVLFTGSYLPWATERNETLKAVDDQFNLVIHSFTPDAWVEQGFKHVYGPAMDEQLPSLIYRAKINLSIDHTIEAGYWSDRNFQIMCCGGYVLFRYVPLSENTFGSGVDYFYNVAGCLDTIRRALDDPFHRNFVSSLGYNYATYLNRGRVSARVYDLLTIVGGIL